eukprot:4670520-Amphidinium_carterae.1
MPADFVYTEAKRNPSTPSSQSLVPPRPKVYLVAATVAPDACGALLWPPKNLPKSKIPISETH